MATIAHDMLSAAGALPIAESAWAVGWTAVASIATAILALFTWLLAKSTSALAKETDQDVRAAWRPVVVTKAIGGAVFVVFQRGDTFEITIDLRLRNVGRGAAVNCEVAAHTPRSDDDFHTTSKRFGTLGVGDEPPSVSVGGLSNVSNGRPSWTEPFDHTILLIYEDIAQTVYETVLCFRVQAGQPTRSERGLEFRATLIDTEPRSTDRKREPLAGGYP